MVYTGYAGDNRYAPYDTSCLMVEGRAYVVELFFDDDGQTPWENDCGCGDVREASSFKDKRPGERPLNPAGRRENRYLYDWHATMKRARKDGWRLDEKDLEKLRARLKREPTKGEIVAQAVQNDFDRIRHWLNGDWHYCTVRVTDVETHVDDQIGGVESDGGDYIKYLVGEMIAGMHSTIVETLLKGDYPKDDDGDFDVEDFEDFERWAA